MTVLIAIVVALIAFNAAVAAALTVAAPGRDKVGCP